MLVGFPPWKGETDAQIYENILKVKYEFGSPDWDDVSTEAKNFVKSLLVLDPKKRPTALECLSHPWIKSKKTKKANTKIAEKMKKYRDSGRR